MGRGQRPASEAAPRGSVAHPSWTPEGKPCGPARPSQSDASSARHHLRGKGEQSKRGGPTRAPGPRVMDPRGNKVWCEPLVAIGRPGACHMGIGTVRA